MAPSFSGSNAALQAPHAQLLTSVVALAAALPALLLMALWRGGGDGGMTKREQRNKKHGHGASSAGGGGHEAPAVVIVDPYSSGGVLARLAYDQGYQVVRVLSCGSQRMADQTVPAACRNLPFAATVVETPTGGPDTVLTELRALGLLYAGFCCGSEPGVELHDALTNRWGNRTAIPSNGEEHSAARRDKFLMSERVRQAGLRAVRQALATEWAEAEAFITGMYPKGISDCIAVILKPVRSSSSEDVTFARSLPEARAAFHRIKGRANQYGEQNEAVLVQEFMAGTEYVVNCVSREGEHKVVSLWRYDKRPANGGDFVYHGVRLFESPDGRVEDALASYIFGVLDALGVVHGPSHAEVMWLENEDAPCLVEIGCRPHGGDGVHTELARRCIGYSQLDAMLGLLLPSKEEEEEEERKGEDAPPAGRTQQDISTTATAILPFDALPPRQPRPLRAHAEVVMLVAHRSGRLLGYPGLPTVRALRSFQDVALKVQPGEMLHATVDYLTNPGWVMLVHEDASVVAADAAAIHALAMREVGGLYAVEGDGKGGGVEEEEEEEEEDEGETSEEEEATPPTSP